MRARAPADRRPARHRPVSDGPPTNDLPIFRATDREVDVVAAVLVTWSEKGAAPPGPVALDGEAPPGEYAVQGGGDDDRTARVDPGSAAART
jgi:hypothetical protein